MLVYECISVGGLLCEFYSSRGIILYLEYQSFCPFVRIGSNRPLSRKQVGPSPPGSKGGGNTFGLALVKGLFNEIREIIWKVE